MYAKQNDVKIFYIYIIICRENKDKKIEKYPIDKNSNSFSL